MPGLRPSPVLFAVALGAAVLGAVGCGGGPLPPDPTAVIGNYSVTITANGISDTDQMYVTVGSNQNVLMSFVEGITSSVRGTIVGSTQLTIPRQTLHVDHSLGEVDGVGSGEGTFVEMSGAESVDFTIHLVSPGYGPADAGAGPSGTGASGVVDYHVTGTRH